MNLAIFLNIIFTSSLYRSAIQRTRLNNTFPENNVQKDDIFQYDMKGSKTFQVKEKMLDVYVYCV